MGNGIAAAINISEINRAVHVARFAPHGSSSGGRMNATEVFDACHGRYRSLREWLEESAGQIRAVDLAKPLAGYQWRPPRGRAGEYVADFERIGRESLRRPEWKGRRKLFEIYFLHSVEYRQAIGLVGVEIGRASCRERV